MNLHFYKYNNEGNIYMDTLDMEITKTVAYRMTKIGDASFSRRYHFEQYIVNIRAANRLDFSSMKTRTMQRTILKR